MSDQPITMTLAEAVATLDVADADVVFEILEAAEVKGVPLHDFRCPIARYLAKLTGNQYVYMSSSFARIDDFDLNNRMPLPAAARQFIRRIDTGGDIGLITARERYAAMLEPRTT